MNYIKKFVEKKHPLLIGKGNSFDLVDKILLSNYFSISLNHVVKNIKTNAVSIIDIDVVRDCGDSIYNNVEYLMIPYYPHENCKPNKKNIVDYGGEIPVLKKMLDEGRVYAYNASSSKLLNLSDHKDLPNHNVYFNNGDSVFGMFAENGIKKIYTIGIDGGDDYHNNFDKKTLGKNGRTFDDSINLIKNLSKEYKCEWIDLKKLDNIEVYVGCSKSQLIPTKVLEYSIKKHTNNPVDVHPLYLYNVKYNTPKDPKCRPRTPFSFQRFFIPSITKNKSIYLDSDMLILKDIKEVYDYKFGKNKVLACRDMDIYSHWRGSEYAVLLLDCKNIKWDINTIIDKLDSGDLTYEQLMFEFKIEKVGHKISPHWNSLDTYNKELTCNLHYTNMGTQPWLRGNHKHENLWFEYLKGAVDNDILSVKLIKEHISRGYIRSIL